MIELKRNGQTVAINDTQFRQLATYLSPINPAKIDWVKDLDRDRAATIEDFGHTLLCTCPNCEKSVQLSGDWIRNNLGVDTTLWVTGKPPVVSAPAPYVSETYVPVDSAAPTGWRSVTTATTASTIASTFSTSAPSTKDTTMSVRNSIKNSIVSGGKLAAVGQAQRAVISKLEEVPGYPEILKSEVGRKAVEVAIPIAVMYACDYDTKGRIPKKDMVRSGAELALTEASRDGFDKIIEATLQVLLPALMEYAKAGEVAAFVEDKGSLDSFVEEVVKERARTPEYAR